MTQDAGCPGIQAAIDALPPTGGQVIIQAGMYTCSQMIVIDHNGVDLRGQGSATVLVLANGANAPVLVIGSPLHVPPTPRKNVHVSDLVIDGNRLNQTSECLGGAPCSASNWLRNNGITLRRVEDVIIERVTVHSARSGGLVTELVCRHVTVSDFRSNDNQLDGLAGYETESSRFAGLYLHDNLAAGISVDIAFNKNVIADSILESNRSVGIFMRDSRDNLFDGLLIENSGEHGVFLAQVDTDATKPATGNTFTGLVVAGSAGAGVRANDASCVNNLLAGSQLIANTGGCVSEASAGLLIQSGVVCR